MPATPDEIDARYHNLLTAVAVRQSLRTAWGANPADDELHKRLMDQSAEVERQIRGLCGLIQSVDVPDLQVPGPVVPGGGG